MVSHRPFKPIVSGSSPECPTGRREKMEKDRTMGIIITVALALTVAMASYVG